MKLVLLSGGSGKRLWPLSNDTRSKQFLKVLKNSNGENQSMVQRVWGQLKSVGLVDSSIIATSKMQRDLIHSQLGTDVPLVIEPERRDTFPAIALAASYLYTMQNVSDDEIIVVLPVDPFVENSFFRKVMELEQVLQDSKADLGLVGVTPTYPSTKYGYIVPEDGVNEDSFFKVSHFSEKPDEEKAEKLIDMSALWNCGVFGFKLKYLINLLLEKGLPVNYEDLNHSYKELPKISFDYEVVEKAEHIVAIPYDGYWKDLGTWNTLTEEMATPQIGKGIICKETRNTHLVNELDIPITVLGVKDLVVAASPDGILVADKALSPNIKNVISGFDQRPMYEERLWGWSRVLDYAKFEDGQEMVTKRICIHEDKNSSYHYHNLRDEVWTIVRGEGEVALDDEIIHVKAGNIIHLPAGKRHGVKAISELEFIEVQTGVGINDNDFVRLYFSWDDIIEFIENTNSELLAFK